MRWGDLFFVDLALPFGLQSAPFIFNSIADLVEWILKVNYSVRYLLHYLDDFLSLGPAGSSACANSITIARSVFFRLGLPLHPSKCEGPTPVLIFLGIELNSLTQTARLPHDKLTRTLELLYQWASKKWCTRTELESLIGSLHHVTKVVPPGRAFLRRMIDLLCAFRSSSHPICLNREFRRDLAWWLELYNPRMESVSFACRRFVPLTIYLSPRIPLEASVLVQFGATRGWRDLGQRGCRPPISRRWSYFPSWSRRTFGGVNVHAYKLSSFATTMPSLPSSTLVPHVTPCPCISYAALFLSIANSISRSPLAMSPVVTTPPLIRSLVLTFRNSAGFIPPPPRTSPSSLQLSCRRCSP